MGDSFFSAGENCVSVSHRRRRVSGAREGEEFLPVVRMKSPCRQGERTVSAVGGGGGGGGRRASADGEREEPLSLERNLAVG